MLESEELLFQPWVASETPQGARAASTKRSRRRNILDMVTLQRLGFAVWQEGRRWWTRWLSSPRVEIYETEDASLVCSAQARWGWVRHWEVLDSEHLLVGMFRSDPQLAQIPQILVGRIRDARRGWRQRYHGTLIEDRYGQLLAWIEEPRAHEPARLLLPDGSEIGTVRSAGPNQHVHFDPVETGNPFVRMVVLAALLTVI
jgi:hypothetical protein